MNNYKFYHFLIFVLIASSNFAYSQTTHTDESNHLKVTTPYGYVQIGPYNGSWSHFSTDRDKFYFNKPIYINGSIHAYTGNNLNLGTYGQTQIIVLESNGNVGIGSTYIYEKLHVGGSIKLSDTGSIPGDLMFVNQGSNGATKQSSIVWDGSNNSTTRRTAEITTGNIQTYARGDLLFKTKGTTDNALPTTKMVIQRTGSVGIGKLTPTAKLHVNGNIIAEEIKGRRCNWSRFCFRPKLPPNAIGQNRSLYKSQPPPARSAFCCPNASQWGGARQNEYVTVAENRRVNAINDTAAKAT